MTNDYIHEESLGYALGRAMRTLGAKINANMTKAGYDVTCEQWWLLFNLGKTNGQSQHELAALTGKDKTTITRLVDNMEKHNLVVRIPDQKDKRQKLIFLTQKGRDMREKLSLIMRRSLEQAQKGIKIKDLQTCKKVLNAIYQNSKS